MVNLGKKFEEIIKRDFSLLDESKITRLYDPTGGYMGIKNVCDFIAYKYPNAFYFEAKETKANTFNFKQLRQYEELCKYTGIKGLHPGVLIWFSTHNKIVWVDISWIKFLQTNGYKSVNINDKFTYDFELEIEVARKYPKINFDKFIEQINIKNCEGLV